MNGIATVSAVFLLFCAQQADAYSFATGGQQAVQVNMRQRSGLAVGNVYCVRARYYSADLKRFATVDPIGIQGGLNLYVYGSDNPLAFLDPLGFCGRKTVFVYNAGDDFDNLYLAGLGAHYDYSYQTTDLADTADVVTQLKNSGVQISRVVVGGHGVPGRQLIGDSMLVPSPVPLRLLATPTDIQRIGASISPPGTIELMGCEVASRYGGKNGPAYLQDIANEAGCPVAAYAGKTYLVPVVWTKMPTGQRVFVQPGAPADGSSSGSNVNQVGVVAWQK